MTGLRRVDGLMGTMIALHLADDLPRPALEILADDFYAWMHDVEARFSPFKDDSEVCRFGRGELAAVDASQDLRDVLVDCDEARRVTDGFFDVYATGAFNPSGYVKGWSAEIASARLAEAGSVNHLVNAGGDIRVRGCPEPGELWHIPIRHPWRHDGHFLLVAVTDAAVATSGTYERGFHVLNPRTGEPAADLRSVTVVGPHLGRADAYATAAVAMGLPGLEWLARLDGYESAVVTEDGQGYSSPGVPSVPLTAQVPAAQRTTGIEVHGEQHRVADVSGIAPR
jgi:FAD:protein FMN transferase